MADATFTSHSIRGVVLKHFTAPPPTLVTALTEFSSPQSCLCHLGFLIPLTMCSNFWSSEICAEMREDGRQIPCNAQSELEKKHESYSRDTTYITLLRTGVGHALSHNFAVVQFYSETQRLYSVPDSKLEEERTQSVSCCPVPVFPGEHCYTRQ
jgi:hypothetical protein